MEINRTRGKIRNVTIILGTVALTSLLIARVTHNGTLTPMRLALPFISLMVYFGASVAARRLDSRVEQDRTSALAQMASTLGFLGFSFRPDDPVLSQSLAELPFAKQFTPYGGWGWGGFRLLNFLQGLKEGKDVVVFDFEWGKSARVPWSWNRIMRYQWTQTVVAFRLQEDRLPTFDLQPKSRLPLFNPGDLRFASHPGFSALYVLRGPDEQAIRALFQPHVLDAFSVPGPQAWVVQGQGEWLIAYRQKVAMLPTTDAFRDLLDEVYGVFAVFGKN